MKAVLERLHLNRMHVLGGTQGGNSEKTVLFDGALAFVVTEVEGYKFLLVS